MANAVEQMAKDFSKYQTPYHLIVCGRSGVGKTHCSERVYRWADGIRIQLLRPDDSRCLRVEWVEFARIAFLPDDEFRRWLDDRAETDWLFVEDLGTEIDRYKTGEPTERLRLLLSEFKRRWLFITSNILPEDWQSKWDDRISDRLMRTAKIITLRNTKRYTEH